MLSGTSSTAPAAKFGPDTTRFRIVPARTLDGTNAEYATYNLPQAGYTNGYNGGYTGVMVYTGTPANGAQVTQQEYDINPNATQVPPSAPQPGGSNIGTNDQRYLSAVEKGGVLWTGGNTQCFAPNTTTPLACMGMVNINVSGSTPAFTSYSKAYQAGEYFYFPALTMDGNKDLILTYSHSSPSVYPEARVAEQLAGTSSFSGVSTIMAGQTTYVGGTTSNNTLRWGDYCGASPDPTTSTSISSNTAWVACEYSASDTTYNNWGTAGAKVTS